MKTYYLIVVALLVVFFQSSTQAQSLNEVLNTPEWLSLTLEHRSRFEFLDRQYRSGIDGSDQALSLRTIGKLDVIKDSYSATLEVMDSRVEFADSGTPLSTSHVNPLDILQANFKFSLYQKPNSTARADMQVGRFTMDVGSRRFIARNRFRNTINAFDGINVDFTMEDESALNVFYSHPVQIRIDGNPLDNKGKMDRSYSNQKFWGVVYDPVTKIAGGSLKFMLLGLNEEDSDSFQTSNRELINLGARVYKSPALTEWDYEVEALFQKGDSRTGSSSIVSLNHRASFLHLDVGYVFDSAWQPRIELSYDYASGDKNQFDDENNSLDSLFGIPRNDYAPTGIYRAFARSNIRAAGISLELKPSNQVSLDFKLKNLNLASSGDGWANAGFFNSPGVSETHLGQQLEFRGRYQVVPEKILLELGGARLWAGQFMDNAGKSDLNYFYFQVLASF